MWSCTHTWETGGTCTRIYHSRSEHAPSTESSQSLTAQGHGLLDGQGGKFTHLDLLNHLLPEWANFRWATDWHLLPTLISKTGQGHYKVKCSPFVTLSTILSAYRSLQFYDVHQGVRVPLMLGSWATNDMVKWYSEMENLYSIVSPSPPPIQYVKCYRKLGSNTFWS